MPPPAWDGQDDLADLTDDAPLDDAKVERLQALMDTLRNPAAALPLFAQVFHQKHTEFRQYDPKGITDTLQTTILDYLSEPPRSPDGQTLFLTVLYGRQGGKSLTTEYGCYCKAAYTPGWDHVVIADTSDRATYLHGRLHHLHKRWPEELRSPSVTTRETKQLTFDSLVGGKMRILSAEGGAVGIGQSPDSFHASEPAFWADFAGSMVLINPSIVNRDNALVVFECTPWEANTDWHEHCLDAKAGRGRHTYYFAPYWDCSLNRRKWNTTWTTTNEEVAFLDRYGPQGLKLEHLAFRRFMLDHDRELRRHPERFQVFYPFDDVTCWLLSANAAVPAHALARHQSAVLVPWRGPYMEYEPPRPNTVYVIGCDPAGHAARDHAAFQVLKCVEGRWTQVAVYADHVDPLTYWSKLEVVARRYNNALIAVESNGVGQGTLSLARQAEYPNIYYEKRGAPGWTSSPKSLDHATSWLIDGLLEELVLRDDDTVQQLASYKHDKRIEEGPGLELLRGAPSTRRRERHHWDKVSALILAVVAARRAPVKAGAPDADIPMSPDGAEPVHPGLYTGKGQAKRWAEMQAARSPRSDPWYRRGGRFH